MSVTITGLDKLQKDLAELSSALASLDGEVAQLRFTPSDPASVQRAIEGDGGSGGPQGCCLQSQSNGRKNRRGVQRSLPQETLRDQGRASLRTVRPLYHKAL